MGSRFARAGPSLPRRRSPDPHPHGVPAASAVQVGDQLEQRLDVAISRFTTSQAHTEEHHAAPEDFIRLASSASKEQEPRRNRSLPEANLEPSLAARRALRNDGLARLGRRDRRPPSRSGLYPRPRRSDLAGHRDAPAGSTDRIAFPVARVSDDRIRAPEDDEVGAVAHFTERTGDLAHLLLGHHGRCVAQRGGGVDGSAERLDQGHGGRLALGAAPGKPVDQRIPSLPENVGGTSDGLIPRDGLTLESRQRAGTRRSAGAARVLPGRRLAPPGRSGLQRS